MNIIGMNMAAVYPCFLIYGCAPFRERGHPGPRCHFLPTDEHKSGRLQDSSMNLSTSPCRAASCIVCNSPKASSTIPNGITFFPSDFAERSLQGSGSLDDYRGAVRRDSRHAVLFAEHLVVEIDADDDAAVADDALAFEGGVVDICMARLSRGVEKSRKSDWIA
jgi:hypothetical protein